MKSNKTNMSDLNFSGKRVFSHHTTFRPKVNIIEERMEERTYVTDLTEDYYNKKNAFFERYGEKNGTISFIYLLFSNLMNVLSIFIYIVQTFNEDKNDQESVDVTNFLNLIDFLFALFFLSEYLLSPLFISGKELLDHFINGYALIDAVSIINSTITYFFGKVLNLQFLRIFRTFKIYRIYKVYKTFLRIQNKMKNDEELTDDYVNPISMQFFNMLVTFFCNIFLGTGFILLVNDVTENAYSKKEMNFIDALYFCIISSTTIGYGDVIPTNSISRFTTVIFLFIFLYIISDQLSRMTSLLLIWGPSNINYQGEGHIVVYVKKIEYRSLKTFLTEIRKKYFHEKIVIINGKKNDLSKINTNAFPFHEIIFLQCQEIDPHLLANLSVNKSRVVFILCEKKLEDSSSVEKANENIILVFNKYCPDVPVYVMSLFSQIDKSLVNNIKLRVFQRAKATFNNLVYDSLGSTKNVNLIFNKMIPIYRLKQMMLAKSLVNPGFATFIQNLAFNRDFDEDTWTDEKYNFAQNNLITNYIQGCQYKIHLLKPPSYLIGKCFLQAVKDLYSYSIEEYINNFEEDVKPLLVIGLSLKIDDRWDSDLGDEFSSSRVTSSLAKQKLLIYPVDYNICEGDQLVVIAYDERNYLSHLNYTMKSTYKQRSFTKGLSSNEISMSPRKNTKNAQVNINILPPKIQSTEEGQEKIFSPHDCVNDITIKLADALIHHYGYVPLNYSKEPNYLQDTILEERIYKFEQEKEYPLVHPLKAFENHIVIFGYQENLQRLLLLIDYHFCDKDIVIISDDKSSERKIRKIMRQFFNVYYIQCDPANAEYLVYAGISKAFKCIFLSERIAENVEDDLQKILAFKLVDNYFQADGLIEIQKESSRSLLGYNPMSPDGNVTSEYLHPLFLSGNIIYTTQLDKLIATSFMHEIESDSVCKLITSGYDIFDYVSVGIPIKSEVEFPIIITVKIPKGYRGKEFCNLANDLLNMDPPCLPLGIYLKSPARYLNSVYNNRMPILQSFYNAEKTRKENSLKRTSTIVGQPNDRQKKGGIKRRSTMLNFEECYDQTYFSQVHKIKDVSLNDKAALSWVDITKTHLPIFITNPQPNFIIEKGTYVQLLVHHKLNPFNKKATLKREQISTILGSINNKTYKRKKTPKMSRKEKQKKLFKQTAEFIQLFQNVKEKLKKGREVTESFYCDDYEE
jgi:voltage-gated potassium channel